MSGLTPERPDRAIARVLAGGLADTPEEIARDLMRLLDRADAIDTSIIPISDGERVIYSVDGPGSAHIVRYNADRRAWSYSID